MDDRREDPTPGKSLGSWRGLIPLGMAAAAALVIGGGVDVVHSHQRAPEEEREAKPAADAEQTASRYIVGVRASGNALVVRDVRTGADVGLPVAAPRGRRFQRVAAVKDGSYVVASYGGRKVTFQRLHLGEDGRPKDLKAIPEATVPGVSTKWSELAVSPRGDRIAYVTYEGAARARVNVVSTASGAHKVWEAKSAGRLGSLSLPGAKLGFVWSPVRSVGGSLKETKHQVRTLDVSGPGGDLRLSKAVMDLPEGSSTAVFTGKTIVAGIAKNSQIALQAYTLEGKPTNVLRELKVKGDLTGLDAAPGNEGFLAIAGDLYTPDAEPVPGEDLADAAW